ncbi:hypothetical protein ES288_A11G224100v1 [Gossypium darwinii]|uniref:Uncharacterized protein n=1 Tax=Gossypium darwinii TaxID=34276 RepID=A0A5D2EMZ1_GOSDA|nr:hypothetical protein ES288_A11G224100v1 [Gossypium darwinii]
MAKSHTHEGRRRPPYLPVREQLFLTIGIDVWREEIKKQRQKPNFLILELIEQRELLCHSRKLIEEGVCLTKAKALFYIFELQGSFSQ